MWGEKFGQLRKLNAAESEEFQRKVFLNRYPYLVAICIVVILFELIMIGTVMSKPGPVTSSISRFTFFILYVVLLLVTIANLIVYLTMKVQFTKYPSLFSNAAYIYSFFICIWGSAISAYTHRTTAEISVFLYVCLFVAIAVPIAVKRVVIMYTVNWAAFVVAVHFCHDPMIDIFPSLVNSAFTTVLAIIVGGMSYRFLVANFLDNKTILQQNEEIQRMNAQLSAIVVVDELTQIKNRRFMDREFPHLLEKARDKNEAVAMMMIDVDHFKQYNDLYGHQAGDECLSKVTRAVSNCLPEEGAYFARYGGEEFILMLIGYHADYARELAERVRTTVENVQIPHEKSPTGNVTISVGLCTSRASDVSTVSQMVHYSDDAMYTAKTSGRNRVCVYANGEKTLQ